MQIFIGIFTKISSLGMEVKPCNGDAPLTDSEGREIDCGNGALRKDCPSNSYCHQTPRFARCCKKGMNHSFLQFYFYFEIIFNRDN